MKRQLFTTTALVTAGVLASTVAHAEEGIKLGLGGYMNNFFGVGNVDDDGNDFNETSLWSDGEVHFTGETTLDNGLTFGANIQLESFASGDQIDENFGYIEGGFGRFQFGSENTAAYLMQYSAPQVGAPISTGWVTNFIPTPAGFTGFIGPYTDVGNDDNTLTYFTPRLFGFQLGASYTPNVVGNGEGSNGPADEDLGFHDGVSVGLNFVESFGGFDVAAAGGVYYSQAPNALVVAGGGNADDPLAFTGGLNIGFAGFTFGGGIAVQTDGVQTATTDNEGYSWDIGLSYGTGPWSFSGVYQYGERENLVAVGNEDEMQSFGAAVEYAVGPGISASLTGMYADYDGEAGADNNGYVGVVGLSFGF